MTTTDAVRPVATAGSPARRVRELDGLRGLAIILVLFGHAFQRYSGVAACGVTVFFALSGYLITGLLLREHEESGRISLRRFYIRRVTRLAPTLLAVVAATVLWCLTLGVYRATLFRDVGSTLLYVANWGLERGDFTAPLAQMWSLSVEEQFYLLWPVALVGVLALTGRRAGVRWLLGTGCAVSMLWRVTLAPISFVQVYYSSAGVAVSLLIGALVATLERDRLPVWTRHLVGVPLAALVGGFALAFVRAGSSIAWTTALGLPLVAATTALALPRLDRVRWLAAAPLTWFGGISYALYLWQTPIEYNGLGHGWHRSVPGLLVPALAIPLAWVTTRYLERPVTRWGHRVGERWGPGRSRELTAP